MRNVPCGMRHAECAMRDAPCGMRHAGCAMRDAHAECAMRNAPCGMRHAGCAMRDAPRRMRHAGCDIRSSVRGWRRAVMGAAHCSRLPLMADRARFSQRVPGVGSAHNRPGQHLKQMQIWEPHNSEGT
eukprot:366311-Chlamydomonas_euryale.AAC.11